MNILLFIPGYNCEKQIKRVLKQLNPKVMHHISEIIFVNNQSTDSTEKVAYTYAKEHPKLPIKILRNDNNYGLGGSHKVAFLYALQHHYDYIIVLHGDDQGRILDILNLLESKIYRSYDCCLGARFHRYSKLEGYSAIRTFGNKVYNKLFSLVVGYKVKDLGSGLNIYSTKMLEDKFYMTFPNDLTFNYCMILATHCYKHHVQFFPITWREEDQTSNVKMINQALKVLGMLFKYILFGKKFLRQENSDMTTAYSYTIIYERDDIHVD